MTLVSSLRALAGPLLRAEPGLALLGRVDFYRFREQRESWGGPLNGQSGRGEMFDEIFQNSEFDFVVETGTYHGTTTRYLAEHYRLPVTTIESNPRCFGFSLQALRDLSNVDLWLGNSVEILPRILPALAANGRRGFFYLDAHWGRDLPLARELSLIFDASSAAVVAIDDFRVPGDAGYGFDDYGHGARLDLGTFGQQFSALRLAAFFPKLPSGQESGVRRGVVVLARRADQLARLRACRSLVEFPVDSEALFKETSYSLVGAGPGNPGAGSSRQ